MEGLDPDSGIAHFNSLVRSAHNSQAEFDMFDPRSEEDRVKLQRICESWDRANAALIQYALLHGNELLKEIDRR